VLVSEFLKVAPGLAALNGAILLLQDKLQGQRVKVDNNAYESTVEQTKTILRHFSSWEILEFPPMYRTGKERYCGWCREELIIGYTPDTGVTKGWCPTHGRGAKVLHAPDPLAQYVPRTESKPKVPPASGLLPPSYSSKPMEAPQPDRWTFTCKYCHERIAKELQYEAFHAERRCLQPFFGMNTRKVGAPMVRIPNVDVLKENGFKDGDDFRRMLGVQARVAPT